MTLTIDYFLAPQSPWTYLGHARFAALAAAFGVPLRVRPMDLGAKVFPVSGGLPLAQRAPQRQAYRLVELARYRDYLGLPLNVQPKFFPVGYLDASRLIVAADRALGSAAAMSITGALLAACWAEERDIANPTTLAELLAEQGLPASLQADAATPEVQAAFDAHTQAAIDAGVFGAPSYVLHTSEAREVFWGQDRLELLRWRLERLGARAGGG